MSYSHTHVRSAQEGTDVVSRTMIAVQGVASNLDVALALGNDQSITYQLDVAKVNAAYLVSDKPLLLKVNSASAPPKFIWLIADVPKVWITYENASPLPIANPFGSTNVSSLVVTNSAAGALSTPGAPAVSNQGSAGGTSYSYKITALNARGETVASSAGTTATGNATLTGVNFNRLTWSAVTGAVAYRVYGRTGGSELLLTTLGTVLTWDDTTAALVPSGALPGAGTTSGGDGLPANLKIRALANIQ